MCMLFRILTMSDRKPFASKQLHLRIILANLGTIALSFVNDACDLLPVVGAFSASFNLMNDNQMDEVCTDDAKNSECTHDTCWSMSMC